ncbi:maleylacetoacetate isomerase [Microbulbifer thermotolerans]|uniref:Maleylacetoacetate isomerase n=1 Tax=Microbulbifer thermotolerans TaxID=252514 RepID=A0A143HKZ1_MICTH|nr:maleylacetoacetate isomerase [Microbulbifer thermotolerans]AMX02384.1 maleylacetoacetate isomerase [Microbulbifer thermotolerans]MCX2779969.1 maleylacetoacetate isomerase [Microbulbifer thermotolerans]MCX2795175.1 maleylacetoacetate isomerase [Microbulbifer thermotolerans]MCX2801796.1 maleylacetoacetate isomerase [Microbulbifer thermotolerans]MCX2805392.1 maleylacetoacetate isomerase [Microbulbifer thermotolerans]
MELHGYFRSSASYRVRIGLNLKGLQYDYTPVNLLQGEQRGDTYRKLNPQGLVPALVDGRTVLTQSLAILEWLDEQYPEPPLLPGDPLKRAKVRALAYSVACDIQPVQNLRVLQYLQSEYAISDKQKIHWIQHWIHEGFTALEKQLDPAPFAGGDRPGLFECCLIPQIYSAQRFGMDISEYPAIHRIMNACSDIAAFVDARPENQPDSTL